MTSSSALRRPRNTRSSCSVRYRALSAFNAALSARRWSIKEDLVPRKASRWSGCLLLDDDSVFIDGNGVGDGHGAACVRRDADDLVDLGFELVGDLGVLAQEALCVVAPLAQPGVAVGEERAGLRDQVVLQCQVQDAALGRDALAVLDVELGLAERSRHLVLDDLDSDSVTDRLGALLERLDAADVQPLRRIELERATTRLRLRRAEHDADLLADLVREDTERVRTIQVAGQLAHG